VIEIASTVRNPVFIPKIKKRSEATSPGLPADKFDRSIFSVDAKRGTLKIAFTKNMIKREMDTDKKRNGYCLYMILETWKSHKNSSS